MNKTSIGIELIVDGFNAPLNTVTEFIDIDPMDKWVAGSEGKHGKLINSSGFSFGFKPEESFDMTIQWKNFLYDYYEKKYQILKARSKFNIERILFLVTVLIYGEEAPYTTVPREAVIFASEINAYIDFDMYFYDRPKD